MSALPPFQIRGLLASTNGEIAISTTADVNAKLVDVRLDAGKQYDELVAAQPVAALGYIDDDEGDFITVGSSRELYDRIDEVRMDQMKPVVFELMASLRRSNAAETAEGLKRWKEFVEREWKGKGPVRQQQAQIIDAMPPTMEDEVSSTSSTMAEAPSSPQIPFLSAFEAELKSLLEKQQQEVDDPEMQAPKSHSSESSSSTSEPSSSSAHSPNDIIFQAIQSIRWAGECMARLKTELPHRAQPAVENLNTVVHNAIAALTAQMHQIALEAAEKAKQAAETTRGVDLGEIEAAKEKIRLLAQGIGHIASQTAVGAGAAARDIARDVRKAKCMAEELGRDVVRGMRVEFGEDVDSPRSGSEGNQSPSVESSIVKMVKPLDAFDSAKKQQKRPSIVWNNSPLQTSASSSSKDRRNSSDDGHAPVPKPFTYHEDVRRLEYQKRLIGNLQRRHTAKYGSSSSSAQDVNPEKKAETFWQHMEKISGHSGSSVRNEPLSRSETASPSSMAGNDGYDEEEEKQAPSEREREVRRARSHYFIRRNRREARQARQDRERETAKQNPVNLMFGEIESEIPQGRFNKSEEDLKNPKSSFMGNPAGFSEPMFMNPICVHPAPVVTKSPLQYPPQQEMLYSAPAPPAAPKPPVDEEQRMSPDGPQGPSDGYQPAMMPPYQIPDFGAGIETRPIWPQTTQDPPYFRNPNIGDHPAPKPGTMRRPHSMYFYPRAPHPASRPLPPKPSVEDATDSEADPRSTAAEMSTLRRHRSMCISPPQRRSTHASPAPPPKPSIQDTTDSEADEHRYARHPSNLMDSFFTHQSSSPPSRPLPSLPPYPAEMSPASAPPPPPPQQRSPSPQFHCSWGEAEQATKKALAERNLGETAVSYNMLRRLWRAFRMGGEEALKREVDKCCRKERIRKERLERMESERMESERREREEVVVQDDEKPVMPGEFVSEETVQEKDNRDGDNVAKNGNDDKAVATADNDDDLYTTPTTTSYRAPDLTLSDSDSDQDPTHPLAYLRPRRHRSGGPSPVAPVFRPRPASPPPPTALDLFPPRGPFDAHFTTPWALKQQWKENQEIGVAMEMERKEREEKFERCVKVLGEMGFVVDDIMRMVVEEAGGEVERVVEMLG
ncbi:hypothetical protein EX30DRAFT_242436 [Ascodesmis nigricans]|uniref:Uncharacterized protein n=1 Tax=Ascodesmis nigricans TaxID=341454 RepID=A0A4S2MQK5_9PEZI|nr:hypothetical protein EX30DRAFT_242436 [Ascodesmis nigricans]